ncbi:RWP-RK transcription factor [Chlorella sorokiniana]|uniref:RWP-RK transcription factor n=1 Tax=Chlorella sorokiniana TaxID=3076 RepID=A0A2P6TCD9_CHLSO|nr:RWP-RK transcription factor [Chlorella sorokiniana]|eukprot:PRW20304.1 RWP-RK transcription factor [Chlorella sorokiniana]
MRLRHRTIRAPRQGKQAGRQGASEARGRRQKAMQRPLRAARPPPGFAAAVAAESESDEEELSEEEEQDEEEADLLLQMADTDSEQQQQQQQQQPPAPTPVPAPPTSTRQPAPTSEARWLAAMALSPLLSLPQLQPEEEAVGVWAAPSSTPAALSAASPGLGVAHAAALPSPAFHDFGGPSLPPRHPLWGSQPAAPTGTAAAAGPAAAGPAASVAQMGAERPLVLVSSDGSGRAGLAAATAAVAREAALFAAGGGATSPPMHPWDLRRPAKGASPLQLEDVQRLQLAAAATPAKVAVPASAANPQPYHLYANGTAVPFEIPHAKFGLPRKPRPADEVQDASAAQSPQGSHLAAPGQPPGGEAAAAAAVQAAFAAAAAEPSPRSAFTGTHYSAGSSLAARHTHAPLSGGLAGVQPRERSQRSRRQRELSEEFHWSDEEAEEGGGGGSDTETEEEDEDMMVDSDESDEESSTSASTRSTRTGAAPSSTGRSGSGRRKGGRGTGLQQHVQQAAVAKRVKQLLHLAAPEAATVMGLSTSKFRQVCRAVGIARWPSRRDRANSDSDE